MRETVALAHPVIPFVTEELWSLLESSGDVLAGSPYPRVEQALLDEAAEAEVGRAIEAITLIRGWRDSVNARPGMVVPARLSAQGYESTLEAVARLARLELSAADDAGGASATDGPGGPSAADGAGGASATVLATVAIPGGVLEVLAEEGLDLAAAEQRRLAARAKLESEIERLQGKLANPGFVEKAPTAVVAGEREKLARLRDELEAL